MKKRRETTEKKMEKSEGKCRRGFAAGRVIDKVHIDKNSFNSEIYLFYLGCY